ncbi:MAG: S41 family peptidase [Woeseiaceae bacterium]|nr:S41 family peptidase [Woeseiaceae bacterium]
MKRMLVLCFAALLTACGGGGGSSAPEPVADDSCSITGQKQFVLDTMRDVYLWNNLLPADVNIDSFATPGDLLAFLTTFQPVDRFSFLRSASDEQAFLEGQFEGFGFSSRFVAANDLRLSRVFVDSPAWDGGLRRGQQILLINGRTIADIEANEGLGAVFGLSPLDFTMREPDGNEFTVSVSQGIVDIDPVPQFRIIDAGGGRQVGYVELYTFISSANAQLDEAFNAFRLAGVNEVVLDLRFNGGGLVSTAELLGDLLGGFNNDGLIFSETLFNADRTPVVCANAENCIERFSRRGASVDLSRLAIIASRGTASASELVPNSLEPYVMGDVGVIGTNTFGKPVGQEGFSFCDQVLRPATFQTVNADGFGDYFDGLPVDCAAVDDLNVPVGADEDPNVIAALEYLASGGCPVTAIPADPTKPGAQPFVPPRPDLRGAPKREYLDAW